MTQRPDGYRRYENDVDLRRARGIRARGARSRRLDGGARARLAARRAGGHEQSSSDRPARSSSSRCARRSRSSSRRRSTCIWEACSRDRPERARGPRAPRHGVVHRGHDGGARVARARRALQPAALDRTSGGCRHAARPHARVSRGAHSRVRTEGDRHRPDQPVARPRHAHGRRAPPRRRDGRARWRS